MGRRIKEFEENYTFEEIKVIFQQYYKMHQEVGEFISSFYYSDFIKIFKTSDIMKFYGMDEKKSLISSIVGLDFDKFKENPTLSQETEEDAKIFLKWISDLNSENVLNIPSPPNLGLDDVRLVKQLRYEIAPLIAKRPDRDKNLNELFISVTNDKKLASALKTLAFRLYRDKKIPINHLNLSCKDYADLCLKGLNKRGRYSFNNKYYNLVTSRFEKVPRYFEESIIEKLRLEINKPIRIYWGLDNPNLERFVSKIEPNWAENKASVLIGGILTSKILSSKMFGYSFPNYKDRPFFRIVRRPFNLKSRKGTTFVRYDAPP